ncbi:hypothetical protein [Streptomyces sp. 6N223]|uniref:hypothetical protein n=1 Tax=Streptomyces sp. 6N223 TaxID=3457412 RepID=UPI003FD24B00
MSDRSDVPELLRAAAAAHQPERERMLARVEAGARRARPGTGRRTALRRPGGLPGWVRVAGATAVLAATLGGAAVATAWIAGPRDPAEAAGHGGEHAGGQSGGPSGGPSAEQTADTVRASGEVDEGGNPYWSQSEVAVTTEGRLTSLTVELHIAQGEGVRATGAWRTLPDRDFELAVEDEGGELVFRWELHENAEIPPGEHIFAGQYDHDAGPRDAGDDWFRVRGDGPRGEVSARGGFG